MVASFLKQNIKELTDLGAKSIGVKVNGTTEEDISEMVDEAIKAFDMVGF